MTQHRSADSADMPPAPASPLTVALDLDGTLDASLAATAFFRFLSTTLRAAGHRVVILSYRPFLRATAEQQLAEWGIVYDHLFWAESRADKGDLCRKLGVDVFFEDNDECIALVDDRTQVLKVRNLLNFDFASKKWMDGGQVTPVV